MLVSTDCARMGVHVPDMCLVVNVGMTMIEIFGKITVYGIPEILF